jgi:beta-mannosidase
MIKNYICKWEVGNTVSPEIAPKKFVPAVVPGAVQLDWARAEGWGDPHIADNWQQYLPLEDLYWLYRATLDFPALVDGQVVKFICGGIDYRFQIRLHGEILLEQEGMFTPIALDITGKAKPGDVLEILIYPHPKSRLEPLDRVQANQSCKPCVSYSWDFHPRLLPSGIWDETHLSVMPANHIINAEVRYQLSEDLATAEVSLEVELSGKTREEIRWELFDKDGNEVQAQSSPVTGTTMTLSMTVENPELWWPHDQGEPVLYTSKVSLLDEIDDVTQIITKKVGFRRVRLVMHPGQWDYPANDGFPKGPSNPPITLEINNRQIFAKGANAVSSDIFPGRITTERHRSLLQLGKDANMNLLRCWGGAPVQKESFFEICDELGIMVWQEFPLACNRYEGTPEYLRVLDQESKSILKRLRSHVSVTIWCAGNELFNVWSGMTEQDAAIRLINRNCYDMDPDRPFLPTSPIMGMGHGHYIFRTPAGKEVFQIFANANSTAYTEFGCGGPSSEELLREIIPAADIFPPKLGTAWETHHAVGAWEPNSHLLFDVIEHYFGKMTNLEDTVVNGQLLQAEGLKCLFQEARRQKPNASMSLNWCFNEPWPCAANMSILEWPDKPKQAYYAVRDSLRPVLASAKISKFVWNARELFFADLWLLNDKPEAVPAGRVEAYLRINGEEIFLLGWDHHGTAKNTNLAGPTVRLVLPNRQTDHIELILRVPSQPEWDSSYYLRYVPAIEEAESVTRRLNN